MQAEVAKARGGHRFVRKRVDDLLLLAAYIVLRRGRLDNVQKNSSMYLIATRVNVFYQGGFTFVEMVRRLRLHPVDKEDCRFAHVFVAMVCAQNCVWQLVWRSRHWRKWRHSLANGIRYHQSCLQWHAHNIYM